MAANNNKNNISSQVQSNLLSDADLISVHSDVDDSNENTDSNKSPDHTGSGTSARETTEEEIKMELAKKETAAVFRLRLLVFLILLLAAVAVSVIVFFVTSNGEKDEFKAQYVGASDKVKEAFVGVVENKLSALMSLAVAVVAHGEDHETQFWPYVTLSSFQQRASTARKQSEALYLHINPEVSIHQREEWENFVVESDDRLWIERGMEYQERIGLEHVSDIKAPRPHHDKTVAPFPMWYYDSQNSVSTDDTSGPWFPTWQASPVVYQGDETNENILANKDGFNSGANITFHSNSVSISQMIMAPPGGLDSDIPSTHLLSLLMSFRNDDGKIVEYEGDPVSKVYFPIYNSFEESRKPVAIMLAWIRWANYFEHILAETLQGLYVVTQDSCNGQYTYLIHGSDVQLIGAGDLHDRHYDHMREHIDFSDVESIADGTEFGLPLNKEFCPFSLDIYPSELFEDTFSSSTPIIMTVAVAIVFGFTAFMFVIYDRLVERRQALVMKRAAQTNAIVASLFPENVRDRLIEQAANKLDEKNFVSQNRRLKGYLNGATNEAETDTPIADLFPECTVMFADIAGFTSWSSTRDPAQVFILLQSVYQAFDKIAKRRKVFKVETIGDSYVAVTGLPEPQPNHAVIMARFAGECRLKMNELTNLLETKLGPDTADLTMRFGMHSGPVTAGVLQGERARFQLFGDTVNTAARMESTGVKNRIQISQTTYDQLIKEGRASWIKPRPDAVIAKGKGSLKTYWLDPTKAKRGSSQGSGSVSGDASVDADASAEPGTHRAIAASTISAKKQDRLVNWMVDLMGEHIRKVVAMRKTQKATHPIKYKSAEGRTSLDEVAEVISLPRFSASAFTGAEDHRQIEIDPQVLTELREYVATIASRYHSNPFHNFEHACHVAMATNKLLKRIVAPDVAIEKAKGGGSDIASELHNYTHGINSDPLTILAIVFSALIHDVDHRGVSNAQLIKENQEMGNKYRGKSVAEQNSLDLSWDLLMSDNFTTLRNCVFTTEAELKRFRQVIVNVVLATDIFDKELNALRKARWEKAFSSEALTHEENNDLRATIVIEHIIQASDVSHTMQHWHIYRKWNKCLFQEMYVAFCEGRLAKDPSEFWYNGELGFFDNYIIPLAKKLKDCNVFGVSSDECLNYALQNRAEWFERGEQITADMLQEFSMRERPSDVEESTKEGSA